MIFINNQILQDKDVCISPLSNGYMFGYGVFETLRTYHGEIFRLNEHIQRLFRSAEILKINHNYSIQDIENKTQETFRASNQTEARIKIVLTETEFLIWIQELTLRPAEWYKTGIPIVTYQAERCFPEAKHMNCLPSYMGQLHAKENNVYEALLIDNNGIVREGCYSNIFWIKDDTLYTTANKVLPGITAEITMEIAKKSMSVEYKDVALDELLQSDECFITNTTSEILPVISINDTILADGKVGECTKRLMTSFRDTISTMR